MKEFNLVFWNDVSKEMGATRRNQKPLKLDLLTTTKKSETVQSAVIATKHFIASPVFKATEGQGADTGVQGYKNTNSYL